MNLNLKLTILDSEANELDPRWNTDGGIKTFPTLRIYKSSKLADVITNITQSSFRDAIEFVKG